MKLLIYWCAYYRHLQQHRKGGFTLLELLITMLIVSIMSVMAYPIVIHQIGKARMAEAKNGLGAINRAQQTYLFEYRTFATSITDLNIDFTLGHYDQNKFITNYYIYSVVTPTQDNEVRHFADPISSGSYTTKAVTSAVFQQSTNFSMVICEAARPTDTPEIVDTHTCRQGRFIR